MGQPVTGPFTERNDADRRNGNYRWWYRGARDDQGQLILEPHPYRSCKWRVVGIVGTGPTAYLGSTGLPYYYLDPKSVNTAYTACYDRFAREVWRDAQTQLAVDLAERHQTLRMLTQTLGKLAKGVKLVRQKRFREAWRHFYGTRPSKQTSAFGRVKWNKGSTDDAFLSNWMQYRYGWTPLLGSIESACAALAKPVRDVTVRSSAKGETHLVYYASAGPLKGKPYIKYDWVHRCRMQGVVAISDPLLASLNQYGLVNPLSVAWELVPLSFVVDWFLPVGDIIEDQTRFVGLSFTSGIISYKTLGVDWYKTNANGSGLPENTCYSTLKQRSTWSGAAPPIPNRWAVTNGLNAKRCLDALAILTGRFRGRL